MTRARLYLILQAVVCGLLVGLLAASAIGIYREGAARKAEHPLESIYSREIVAEKFAPIAPLCFSSIGLLAAGLILGVRDEGADRSAEAPELIRDLTVARVITPSEPMQTERRLQRRLSRIGWTAFAACMLPIAAYMFNPDHFPLTDLEGMFVGLLHVLIPWTAIGLGALSVTASLREKSVLRQTEAAKERLREERAQGLAPIPKPVKPAMGAGILQLALIASAIVLIVAGVFNGSAKDVLYKAINICTECVGLG